ncbi:hypothetical protein P879_01376 [Paragonimus westermani]|uniref:Uncharacterized protein n=1 Tax=Paragonimus westermani TaxID=34504 RepID=A0A8T0DKI9_9TREM|nr:hypothetical protein P879_01376 [Paragonimus westermani]
MDIMGEAMNEIPGRLDALLPAYKILATSLAFSQISRFQSRIVRSTFGSSQYRSGPPDPGTSWCGDVKIGQLIGGLIRFPPAPSPESSKSSLNERRSMDLSINRIPTISVDDNN